MLDIYLQVHGHRSLQSSRDS